MWILALVLSCLCWPISGRQIELLDLSYELNNSTIHWPTAIPFQMFVVHRGLANPDLPESDDNYWYEINEFKTSEHCGTHLDAPGHFSRGSWAVSEIPVERLFAPVSIVDLRHTVKDDADYAVSVNDLQKWEEDSGKKLGPVILLWTGWASRWPDKMSYLGTDTNDTSLLHFPGLDPAAAQWLVDNRQVYGIGIDTASIDRGQARSAPSHRILARQNIFNLENVNSNPLVGKEQLADPYLMASPLKLSEGSGSPIRLILMSGHSANCASLHAAATWPMSWSLVLFSASVFGWNY